MDCGTFPPGAGRARGASAKPPPQHAERRWRPAAPDARCGLSWFGSRPTRSSRSRAARIAPMRTAVPQRAASMGPFRNATPPWGDDPTVRRLGRVAQAQATSPKSGMHGCDRAEGPPSPPVRFNNIPVSEWCIHGPLSLLLENLRTVRSGGQAPRAGRLTEKGVGKVLPGPAF